MRINESLLGYKIYSNNLTECIDSIYNTIIDYDIKKEKLSWLACLNPHSYIVAESDLLFKKSLNDCRWLIPDGCGIILASLILGGTIRSRITGFDIFYNLSKRLNNFDKFSVFLVGSTNSTLEIIKQKLNLEFPNIIVAGVYSPPFTDVYSKDEIDEMVGRINKANADVLWVGLSAPKQEKWIFNNKRSLNVKFAAGIGAVFDFYAGNVKRSPKIFQILWLEWLPRLMQQPNRLWRRNFVSTPLFILAILKKFFF